MSNPVILVPPFTHAPENVSTATSETGRTVASATTDTGNKGTLRVSTSGTPLTDVALHLKLASGGNPRGYNSGAAFAWKNASDPDSSYRYYTDGYVLRERSVLNGTAGVVPVPSTPRQLANGNVGYPIQLTGGLGLSWHSEDAAGNYTRTTIIVSTATLGQRDYDSVVLPSGRIMVYKRTDTGVVSFYSDNNGAAWTALGYVNGPTGTTTANRSVLCAELVGSDAVCLVIGCEDGTGFSPGLEVYWSFDGGYTFSQTFTSAALTTPPRTTVTPAGTVLITDCYSLGNYVTIYECAVGGAPVQISTVAVDCGKSQAALATRDDGTVWVFGVGGTLATGIGAFRMSAAVSKDGGYTWESPSGESDTSVWDMAHASSALAIEHLSAGPAFGTLWLVGRFMGAGGAERSQFTWTAGGYESVGEYKGSPYNRSYSPVEEPNSVGWVRTDFSAGATVTLAGPLTIVSAVTGNTRYRSSALWWTSGTATASKRVRMNIKTTGGSVAADAMIASFSLTDGAGFTYGCKVRFASTQAVILDAAGTTIATINYAAGWKTWIFELRIQGTNLAVSAWIADASSADGTVIFSQGANGVLSARAAGTTDRMDFGGTALAVFSTFEINGIHVASGALDSNPAGHFLPAAYPVLIKSGVRVAGVNAYGMPGDLYYITTAYTYGKTNTWAELRPSRYVQSSADGTPWRIVFDAADDRFSADRVALLGTNFRTARFEMNNADSWATPALSVNLDGTVQTFATFTGGSGSITPTPAPNLRPSQYRSDGDAHRWFLEVGTTGGPRVYEITDNDAERIYCQGVNLIAASGPARVFRDRMGATFATSTYRYASVVIDTQDTSDGGYRLGTPVFGMGYQLPQSYDYGFVDRTEANVSLTTTPAGYRAAARLGPRRHTLAVQWSPINRRDPVRGETDRVLSDVFAALEGSRLPFVFWRYGDTPNDCGIVRVLGTLTRTNVWGESATALTRVDQVTLEEEL